MDDQGRNRIDYLKMRADFLKLFGFGFPELDYTAEVDELVEITDLIKREPVMA